MYFFFKFTKPGIVADSMKFKRCPKMLKTFYDNFSGNRNLTLSSTSWRTGIDFKDYDKGDEGSYLRNHLGASECLKKVKGEEAWHLKVIMMMI